MWLALGCAAVHAQDNDMILNRPYADTKLIHLGFSVGMNFQNLAITNNGFVTDDGEEWYADVSAISPGFCVNVLADLRIAEHFNLRFSPGLYFGNKVVRYLNHRGNSEWLEQSHYKQSQNVKSTYIVVPLELKMSAKRMGCDFYMPFFKFCPEVKFCFGLKNLLDRNRPDLEDNPEVMRFTQSVNKVQNNMVVVTFFFE